jgi:hypothetical protein
MHAVKKFIFFIINNSINRYIINISIVINSRYKLNLKTNISVIVRRTSVNNITEIVYFLTGKRVNIHIARISKLSILVKKLKNFSFIAIPFIDMLSWSEAFFI